MADQLLDTESLQSDTPVNLQTKKEYRSPVLAKLGSLRDMTLASTNLGANDGRPSMGTKRGGNFEAFIGTR